MAQVLVRNLPDDVVARLKVKAAEAEKSLEQYLREILEREAADSRQLAFERLRQLRESMPYIEGDLGEIIRQGRKEREADLERALRGEE